MIIITVLFVIVALVGFFFGTMRWVVKTTQALTPSDIPGC